jgi:4-hydroxythreonine-4-phosphate dehydrogenase
MKMIGITMGDPLGIGAELILKSLPKFRDRAKFCVFGDAFLLGGIPKSELVSVTQLSNIHQLNPEQAGRAAVGYLDQAMEAYSRGEIHALVTAPISKAHVQLAGFPFPGHTEYLAHKTKTKKFVMMMAGPRLRVTLVTIHEPLSKIPKLLSISKILDTVEITWKGLQERFHINNPRIAICGLNPHAGEGGLLGSEEKEIIAPAIEEANKRGYVCSGPKVPDAVFHEAYEGGWDAIICMYHDQGLIPFKMIHFKDGVNVTLGLPLIRTSPDHGTAFDIAGKGIADSSSMEAAINMAIEMSEGIL